MSVFATAMWTVVEIAGVLSAFAAALRGDMPMTAVGLALLALGFASLRDGDETGTGELEDRLDAVDGVLMVLGARVCELAREVEGAEKGGRE